jgi:hypothetical protein
MPANDGRSPGYAGRLLSRRALFHQKMTSTAHGLVGGLAKGAARGTWCGAPTPLLDIFAG